MVATSNPVATWLADSRAVSPSESWIMALTEPRFVCDETGDKVAVVLPVDLSEKLVELLEQHDDRKAIDEAMQDAERIPWEQVKIELGVSG